MGRDIGKKIVLSRGWAQGLGRGARRGPRAGDARGPEQEGYGPGREMGCTAEEGGRCARPSLFGGGLGGHVVILGRLQALEGQDGEIGPQELVTAR